MVIAVGVIRYKTKVYTARKSKILMDTIVEISINSKDKNINDTMEKTIAFIKKLDNKFSYYEEDSYLNQLNIRNKTKIDQDFYELLQLSKKIYIESDSLFDVSIAPLVDLWDFSRKELPNPDSLEESLRKVNYSRIVFDKDSINIPSKMKLNFGALAKGFIIDKTIQFLKRNDVDFGYINAGGDIRFFGYDRKIKLGIQHPRNKNKVISTLSIKNQAIVTSGDYERFFEIDGKRYHHIINPKTGYPVKNTISVTVLAPTAVLADALSTAVFLLKPEEGINLIKTYPHTEAIIYYKTNNEIISLKTMGIKDKLIKEKSDEK